MPLDMLTLIHSHARLQNLPFYCSVFWEVTYSLYNYKDYSTEKRISSVGCVIGKRNWIYTLNCHCCCYSLHLKNIKIRCPLCLQECFQQLASLNGYCVHSSTTGQIRIYRKHTKQKCASCCSIRSYRSSY